MTTIELFRCTLAIWLDRQKDRLDSLIERVSPASEVWDRYDEWSHKRGHYDWIRRP